MKNKSLVFKMSWITGLLIAFFLYFIFFDKFSETELVRFSYGWLPLIIFGLVGYAIHELKLKEGSEDAFGSAINSASKWTIGSMTALIVFFETVWEGL